MLLSIIVAFDKNQLIGRNNKLPWHMPADLKHFKSITMGHHMIMGRKTFESIGKPLPGRVSVVITRQKDYVMEGCHVVNSIEEAIEFCKKEEEVFIIGGAEIFEYTMPLVNKLYVTQIHHAFEGDTWFPDFREEEWELISVESHPADEKNEWPCSFVNYRRKI